MESRAHLANDLECFSCCFEAFALDRRATWILYQLCAHVAFRVHPGEIDAVHTDESHCVDGEANNRRLHEHIPLLAGSHQVNKVPSSLETLLSAVFPVATWDIVFGWWEKRRIQRSLRLLTPQRDEWNILSVKHDLAKKVHCVH
jgi:hypothetical protein